MSTVPKPPQPQPVRPLSAPVKPAKAPQAPQTFLFDKENYMLMIAGIALVFIGFMLMSGGKSADPTKFNYDEIYSFRRITLAPIIVLSGFVVEVFAIMRKPKETQTI